MPKAPLWGKTVIRLEFYMNNLFSRPGVTRFLLLSGAAGLAASQWLVFMYAPLEVEMELIQKIFYIHLPLAWGGLLSFCAVFGASIAYLWSNCKKWHTIANCGASLGVLLASLALVTGAFWAKKAWGVWWTWEPRLTTTLIMCFVYAAYLIVRNMDLPPERRSKIAAVIGIAAFLDVPLVYFSARLWSYIHPKSMELELEMKITLIACVASFALLWLPLLAFRAQLARDEQKLDTLLRQRLMKEE